MSKESTANCCSKLTFISKEFSEVRPEKTLVPTVKPPAKGIGCKGKLGSVSSITAGLASAFTVSLSELAARERFTSPADLQGARIAVVSVTSSVDWGQYYQAKLLPTDTLKEALELVVSGQTEGAIFDRPALQY